MNTILKAFFLILIFASPLTAQELTGTLQQIQKAGKVKVGYRHSHPPMSFLAKDGNPDGYSVDICRLIVDEIKTKLGAEISIEYIPVTAEKRFDSLVNNEIDILCGATTKTLSRGELVDFTQLTFVTGASFMSLKETKIRNNFDGKKVGVIRGTTTALELKKLFKETPVNADIILLKSAEEGLDMLKQGTIDAFSSDQVVLFGLALDSGEPEKFTILYDLFSFEPYALAVRRNDADFRLIADRVISRLYRTRDILKIYKAWFGEFASRRTMAFDALIQLNATPE